nr:ribonuclease H-like domain-containing protein [Tanacetum cinerariifolium]
ESKPSIVLENYGIANLAIQGCSGSRLGLCRTEVWGKRSRKKVGKGGHVYALAAIGEPVKDKDLVMLVVLGLCEEYNDLKTIIISYPIPTAFSELHALLSDHDYMLGKTRAPTPSITPSFAANYALGSPSIPEARQAQLSEPSTNISNTRAQSSNASTNWHIDIGVNSHVTPNLEAMDHSKAYHGDDTLHVGNDVQNAFLYGNLMEQVYMKQPPGFIDPQRPNHKYILELLQRAGLSNCNPMSSLMVTSSSLSLDDNIAFSNPVKYRHVVGALQYVTLSRPDIAFDVNKVVSILLLNLSQMLNRIGIQMIDGPLWFAIYLGSNLISRTTRKPRTVSRSFTEAEYKALPDMDSSTSS